MADPEYIVVGSGAGGGPLAARLAELGHRVLLLEAGGEEEPWNYQVPVLHGLATEDEEMRLDHYIRHYADDTRQQKDPKYEAARGGVFYPRARTLGGCTAHYAMIIIRPHDSDWQAVRDATRDGSWAPAEMNKYFARVERCLYRDGSTGGHGKDGWLPTRFPDAFDLVGDIIRHRDPSIAKIAIEAKKSHPARLPIGLRDAQNAQDLIAAKFDPNDMRVLERRGTGLIAVPMAISENGRRAGTRERIRAAAQATGRLEVRTHSHVTGLVFDEQDPLRAVGVRYLSGARLYRADRSSERFGTPTGPAQEVRASREVILSAGAYITPQLLMLSGIGPRAALAALGRGLPAGPPRGRCEPAGPVRGRHRRPSPDRVQSPQRGHVQRSRARRAAGRSPVRGLAPGPRSLRHERRRRRVHREIERGRERRAGPVHVRRAWRIRRLQDRLGQGGHRQALRQVDLAPAQGPHALPGQGHAAGAPIRSTPPWSTSTTSSATAPERSPRAPPPTSQPCARASGSPSS